jgi:hypothetical protein
MAGALGWPALISRSCFPGNRSKIIHGLGRPAPLPGRGLPPRSPATDTSGPRAVRSVAHGTQVSRTGTFWPTQASLRDTLPGTRGEPGATRPQSCAGVRRAPSGGSQPDAFAHHRESCIPHAPCQHFLTGTPSTRATFPCDPDAPNPLRSSASFRPIPPPRPPSHHPPCGTLLTSPHPLGYESHPHPSPSRNGAGRSIVRRDIFGGGGGAESTTQSLSHSVSQIVVSRRGRGHNTSERAHA